MKNEFSIIFIVKEEGVKGKKMKICFIAFKIGFIITLFGIFSGFYHFYKNENYDGYPREIMIEALGTAIMTFSILLSAM